MFWDKLLKLFESFFVYIFVLIGVAIIIPFAVIGALVYLPIDAVSEVWSEK